MRTPEFEVDAKGYGLSVHWEDAERRYHFWLNGDGTLKGDVLHSNLKIKPQKYGDHGHRKMSLAAKRWAPIVEEMMRQIAEDDLIARAIERAETEENNAKAEAARVAREAALARLHRASLHLPEVVRDTLRGLPEDVRFAFVSSLDM